MRAYAPLSRELYQQALRVPASRDGELEYRPCAVTLDDGREFPRVYVVDQMPFIRTWGGNPEDGPGKRVVPIESVRRIADSPHRLPAQLANELYRAGESGMGYAVFTVEFRNGVRQAYLTGNAVDFIEPPDGLHAADAVAVWPHEGTEDVKRRGAKYHWCLHDGIEIIGAV